MSFDATTLSVFIYYATTNLISEIIYSANKQEGNIHRLRTNEEDSEDDTGTWNGNSTQQM
jgi:uncharacterized membrane protein YsdA (DUF1294 family)